MLSKPSSYFSAYRRFFNKKNLSVLIIFIVIILILLIVYVLNSSLLTFRFFAEEKKVATVPFIGAQSFTLDPKFKSTGKTLTSSEFASNYQVLISSRGGSANLAKIADLKKSGLKGPIVQYILLDGLVAPTSLSGSLTSQKTYCSSTEKSFEAFTNNVNNEKGSFCQLHDSIVGKSKNDTSKMFDHDLNPATPMIWADESWFLHDATTGSRLTRNGNSGNEFYPNPAIKEYREYFTARVLRELTGGVDLDGSTRTATGMDGIYLDNISLSWNKVLKVGKPKEIASSTDYTNAVKTIVTETRTALKNKNQNYQLWGNLIEGNNNGSQWDSYIPLLDGASLESYSIEWGNNYVSETTLKNQMLQAEKWIAAGKYYVAIAHGDDAPWKTWVPYSVAAFYMITDGKKASYTYTDYNSYSTLYDIPEMHLALGNPLGAKVMKSSSPLIFTRSFECGSVELNVTAKTTKFNVIPNCFATTPTPTPIATATPTPLQNIATVSETKINLTPTDDAVANAKFPTTNYNSTTLEVDTAPQAKTAYLKFSIPNPDLTKRLKSATLELSTANTADAGSLNTQSIKRTSTITWSEKTLNFNNKPTLATEIIGTIETAGKANTTFSVDLTNNLKTFSGGLYGLAISNNGDDGADFNSKEATTNKPVLKLVYENYIQKNITVNANQDGFVDSALPTTVFNTKVLSVDKSPSVKISYIKFDLTPYKGKDISNATFKLSTANIVDAASIGPQNIKTTNNSTWSESTLNYNNRPTVGSSIATITTNNQINSAFNFDITPTIKNSIGQTLTLAIDSENQDGVDFNSRESTDAKPTLLLTYYELAFTYAAASLPVPTATAEPTPSSTPTSTTTPTPTSSSQPTSIPSPTPTRAPINTEINIWTPRLGNPVFIQKGQTFTAEIIGDKNLDQNGWTANLKNELKTWPAIVTSATYGSISAEYENKNGWTLKIQTQTNTPPELLELEIKNTNSFASSPQAVSIVENLESNFYVLKLTDEHVAYTYANTSNQKSGYRTDQLVKWVTPVVNVINPRFVINAGDETSQYNGSEYRKNSQPLVQMYKDAKKAYTVPSVTIPGNHDIPLNTLSNAPGAINDWEKIIGQRAFVEKIGSVAIFAHDYSDPDAKKWIADQYEKSWSDSNIKYRIILQHFTDWNAYMPSTLKPCDLMLIGHLHNTAKRESTCKTTLMTLAAHNYGYSGVLNFEKSTTNSWTSPSLNTYVSSGVVKLVEDFGDPKVSVVYSNKNDGTSSTNSITIKNTIDKRFFDGRLKLLVPNNGNYTITNGKEIARYTYDNDKKLAILVQVDIKASATTTVVIRSATANSDYQLLSPLAYIGSVSLVRNRRKEKNEK